MGTTPDQVRTAEADILEVKRDHDPAWHAAADATLDKGDLAHWQRAWWQHHVEGVACLDAHGRVAQVNPAFAAMLGEAADALCGLTWPALLERLLARCSPSLLPPTLPAAPQDLTLILASGGTLGLNHHLLPDGSRLVVLRDLSAEAQAERSRSDFLALAAHELRTPLASLVGFSELMRSRLPTPERTREMADIFHRQSVALAAMIGDLMDLARLDARGARDFRWRAVPVQELLSEAVRGLGPQAARVRVTHDDAAAVVWADVHKGTLAVMQALSHALRQSPEHTDIAVHSRPSLARGQAGVEIVVQDEGAGLTREQMAHAFERFYRGEAETAPRGAAGRVDTGLGLSLVQTIVQLHHGRVQLHSEPGAGSRITLWWPTPLVPDHGPGSASDPTHFAALVTTPSSGANCPSTRSTRARRPRRSSPANLLKGGTDEPDDQRTPPGSDPGAS